MRVRNFLLLAAVALAGAAACNKHEVVHHGKNDGHQNENTPPTTYTFELKENTDWTIGYLGRQDYRESDGTMARVDAITVNGVTAGMSYLVSVISRDNYASYGGKVEDFLKDEAKYNAEYIYDQSSQTIYFDPFRHGTWYGFIIALNPDKSASGEYAWAKFEISEEAPSEAYSQWIGSWTITGDWKGMGVTYELTVSQQEANYVYRVDGWETGKSIDKDTGTVMDQEYLETFFDAPSGSMYFVSQYIQSYTDDNLGDMDECFLGEIDYDGITEEMGLYIITDEGLDLAEARLSQDGKSANLLPCTVRATVGNDTVETSFYDMRYFGYAVRNQSWYPYNDNIPAFPLTMTRVEKDNDAPKVIGRRSLTPAPSMPSHAKVHRSRTDRQQATAVKLR